MARRVPSPVSPPRTPVAAERGVPSRRLTKSKSPHNHMYPLPPEPVHRFLGDLVGTCVARGRAPRDRNDFVCTEWRIHGANDK